LTWQGKRYMYATKVKRSAKFYVVEGGVQVTEKGRNVAENWNLWR